MRNAHFLHRRPPLDPLISPSLPSPRVLCWLGSRLLVASTSGMMIAIELDGGARSLCMGPPEPVALTATDTHIGVVGRSGLFQVFTHDGQPCFSVTTPCISQVTLLSWPGGWMVSGDDVEGERRLRLFDPEGHSRMAARLPMRTVVGVRPDGSLFVARSLADGFFCRDFGTPVPDGPVTSHQLRAFSAGRVIGVGNRGVFFWETASDPEGRQTRSLRVMDVAQAIWASQDHVALGLRSGHIVPIALSALDRTRTQKIQAHESAVMALSFSNDGKFLSSIGDNCRIWAVNF